MTNFEVSFNFNDNLYTASIQKNAVSRIKYIASINAPHDLNLEHEISFIAPRKSRILGWVNINSYPQLMPIIAAAIMKYADDHQFSLFKA